MALPKINTDYWKKPIPLRQFDWSATYDDYDLGSPIGHGRTEAQAVVDLIENNPRGVQCERDRCCGTCTSFAEVSRPFPDDPYFTVYRCHRHHRGTSSDGTCSDHEFDGERDMERTLPAPAAEPEIAF